MSGRVQAVATFLDQGLSVEAVVDRTAVPEGEVQVLKNLRRAQRPAGLSAPGRRGAAAGSLRTAGLDDPTRRARRRAGLAGQRELVR